MNRYSSLFNEKFTMILERGYFIMFTQNLIDQIYNVLANYYTDEVGTSFVYIDIETLMVYSSNTPRKCISIFLSKELLVDKDKYKAIIEMALLKYFN